MEETVCYNLSYNKKTRWRVWNGGKDMKQGRRELNKLQCRQRILKASRQLFSATGYDETTMEDVAERAGVSKATLYNYFPSKDSLLMGIAEAELEDVRQLIAGALQDEPSGVEKLRLALLTFVMDSINYVPLSRKITYLNSQEGSGLFATRLGMLEIFRALVEEAQEKGELSRETPAGDIVDLVMGAYLTALFQWPGIGSCSRERCVERLDRLFRMVLAGVLRTERGDGEAGV